MLNRGFSEEGSGTVHISIDLSIYFKKKNDEMQLIEFGRKQCCHVTEDFFHLKIFKNNNRGMALAFFRPRFPFSSN